MANLQTFRNGRMIFHLSERIATDPAEGECFVNRWWVLHPEHGLTFYCKQQLVPLAYKTEKEARSIGTQLFRNFIVRQIRVVYLAHARREMLHHRESFASPKAAASA
jgi:hypothetical protein